MTRSSGCASGATATRMVCARSAALMPVVTPWRASMETVNAVPSGGPLRPGDASSAARGGRRAPRRASRQMRPRPCMAMKLMASGVTISAAMHEIALVLAVLVVDEDDHLARANLIDRGVDAAERSGSMSRRCGMGGEAYTKPALLSFSRSRASPPAPGAAEASWRASARRSERASRPRGWLLAPPRAHPAW